MDKAVVVGGMRILAAVQKAVQVVVKVEVRAREQAGKASYGAGAKKETLPWTVPR